MEISLKSTGVVRKIDETGRIVLPKELRKTFNIKDNETALEIFTSGDMIILQKYEPFCTFCGSSSNLTSLHNKNVCDNCVKELSKKG